MGDFLTLDEVTQQYDVDLTQAGWRYSGIMWPASALAIERDVFALAGVPAKVMDVGRRARWSCLYWQRHGGRQRVVFRDSLERLAAGQVIGRLGGGW